MSPSTLSQTVQASLAAQGQMAQAILEMLNRAERAIDIDPHLARACIDQASRLLAPAPQADADVEPPATGLAPWQERKVSRHIDEHLAQPISVGELAQIVGLSATYFSRCFKRSFGVPPREYLIRRRLERAKSLMTETGASLCEIALDSGFCDQSHMSRAFSQIVGSTPRRWRRDHTFELAA